MSYAISNDGQGSRSVSGPDEVGADEYYSDEPAKGLPENVTLDLFRAAIQEHLDEAAKVLGYDDIKSAATYAEEPAVRKFQDEGRALRAWRSLVWEYGYKQIDEVRSGARDLPSTEQLIKELPALALT